MHPQLPLDLAPDQLLTFETFWTGENRLLLEVMQQIATGTGVDTQIYISGAAGSGKTHLLSATCQLASEQGYRIAYVSAEWIHDASMLQGYEQFDLVCVDDLQKLSSGRASELALFGLINGLRQNNARLLVSATSAAGALEIALPDLLTRLHWGASYALAAVPEDQIASALRMRALHLGVRLADEVAAYLQSRYPRDLSAQVQLLTTLNTASLQAKRKITIPFVREVLPL